MPSEGSLLAFAAREFALSTPMQDGTTQRDHIESYTRQTGVVPEGWEAVTCPPELQYLWVYFVDMSRRRTSTGFGFNPIPFEGIAAWEHQRGIKLERFEYQAMDALEMMFLSAQNKAKKK